MFRWLHVCCVTFHTSALMSMRGNDRIEKRGHQKTILGKTRKANRFVRPHSEFLAI